MEIQIFQHAKNIIFQKILLKKSKSLRYHNSITNLKFQHKPKYHISYKK
jgi:hypothetical protein